MKKSAQSDDTDSDYENVENMSVDRRDMSMNRARNSYRVAQGPSGCQQPETTSDSSDDTESEMLAKTMCAPTAPNPDSSSYHQIPREYDEEFLISRVIGFVSSADEENATMHLVRSRSSSSTTTTTTPTPTLISGGIATPATATSVAYNSRDHGHYRALNDDIDNNTGHGQMYCLTDWSSSDEETSFYNDRTSVLSSAIGAERQLVGSEYFNSSRGGY